MKQIIRVARAIIQHPELSPRQFLVGQNSGRKKNDPNHITFLGGVIARGENAETALIREIKEEAGIDIIPQEILFTLDKTSDVTILTDFFWCATNNLLPTADGKEIQLVYWASLDHLLLLPEEKISAKTKRAVEIIRSIINTKTL